MRDPIKPVVKIQSTNKAIYDQGLTYNQAGLTYNEPGIAYGGLYGQDSIQIVAKAKLESPSIVFAGDFAGQVILPPGSNAGIPIATGFFMFITYI